jgi:hypothetical protein
MAILELVLNWLGSLLFGTAFIELGLSLWQSRKFSKRIWLAIFFVAIGARAVFGIKCIVS